MSRYDYDQLNGGGCGSSIMIVILGGISTIIGFWVLMHIIDWIAK